MERNVIFRPAYNRPEMLQLSIDHEIEARNIAGIQQNEYLTYFLLEYGAPLQKEGTASPEIFCRA